MRATAASVGRSSRVPTIVRCSGVAAHWTMRRRFIRRSARPDQLRACLGELAGGHQHDERVGGRGDASEIHLVAVRGAARDDREALRDTSMRDRDPRHRRRGDRARDTGHDLDTRRRPRRTPAAPRRRGRTRTGPRPSAAPRSRPSSARCDQERVDLGLRHRGVGPVPSRRRCARPRSAPDPAAPATRGGRTRRRRRAPSTSAPRTVISFGVARAGAHQVHDARCAVIGGVLAAVGGPAVPRSSSARPWRTNVAASAVSSDEAHLDARSPISGRNGIVAARTSRRTASTSAHSSPNAADSCSRSFLASAGRGAARGDREDELAAADDRGGRPIAIRDVVHDVHQDSAVARFARDRIALGRVVRRGDADERPVEIGGPPRATLDRHTSVQRCERLQPRRRTFRDDRHRPDVGCKQSLDLALADRGLADHDRVSPRELQEHRVAERHRYDAASVV